MAFAASLEQTVKDFANKDADYIMAEYIWIDGDGGLRGKTKVIRDCKLPLAPGDVLGMCPDWNFDGSSTKQAPGEDSEVVIKPRAAFRDPFRGGSNVIVMCDCYTPTGVAIPTNTRVHAARIFDKGLEEEPWFGIEQEYTLFQDGHPLGWPRAGARAFGGPCVQVGFPGPQGPYYCSAGADVAFGREVADAHMKACLYAGLTISGINGEVMPGQWEYQVGPCTGIASGDQLWVSRYILLRVCEELNIVVSLDPKPIPGDWNGAGCHTNYSTKKMREMDHSFELIMKPMLEKMRAKHKEHVAVYGEGNERRLTGAHETASIEEFSYGVANRGASVRIPNETAKRGKGYFEDRRPASNMDPYVVTSMIFNTTVVGDAAPSQPRRPGSRDATPKTPGMATGARSCK